MATATTTKRRVRRQSIGQIIGKDPEWSAEARTIVFQRTGIVIEDGRRYMFRCHGAVTIDATQTARSIYYERTALEVFRCSTALHTAENPVETDIDGKPGISFGRCYVAELRQMRNCEYHARVTQWFCGLYSAGFAANDGLIGKNINGEIVAIICGRSE